MCQEWDLRSREEILRAGLDGSLQKAAKCLMFHGIKCTTIYIYIYVCMYLSIFTYLCLYLERERERERGHSTCGRPVKHIKIIGDFSPRKMHLKVCQQPTGGVPSGC